MNRKSFLTTALLSFAALFMPRKTQGTPPPTPSQDELNALLKDSMRRMEAATPTKVHGVDFGHSGDSWAMMQKRDKGLWEQVAVGHWPEVNPHASLVCYEVIGPTLGTTPEVIAHHYDWFWVGPADGVALCDWTFLNRPAAVLPQCISPCPSHLSGHLGFMLTQEVLAFAAPDERLVVFPDGDDGKTPVYYLGSWIHPADGPPRWVAP